MTEKNLQSLIRLKLSQLGLINYRLNAGKSYQGKMQGGKIIHPRFIQGLPKGTPDLLAIQNVTGRAIFIEVKTATGIVSKEQHNAICKLKQAGAIAGVVRSVEDLMKLLGDK